MRNISASSSTLAPPPPSSVGTPASTRPAAFSEAKIIGYELVLVGGGVGAFGELRPKLAGDVGGRAVSCRVQAECCIAAHDGLSLGYLRGRDIDAATLVAAQKALQYRKCTATATMRRT
jgi:hypothetical protein